MRSAIIQTTKGCAIQSRFGWVCTLKYSVETIELLSVLEAHLFGNTPAWSFAGNTGVCLSSVVRTEVPAAQDGVLVHMCFSVKRVGADGRAMISRQQ
jgi:hypothetical protein